MKGRLAPNRASHQRFPEFMYAEPQQQYRISSPSRQFLIALLFSAVSHAVALTLVHPSATPTPAIAPLRVVLTSPPPIAMPAPATVPEPIAPTPEPVAEPEPPPEPVVKPEVPPEPATKPVKRRITHARQPRPKRPPTPPPLNSPPPAAPQDTVMAALATTPPMPAAAATATAESRKVEYLYNPPPDYPPRARRLGLEGEVLIRTRVLPNGESDQLVLERSSGYALLDAAAMEAVRKWRFRPAQRGTEEIVSWVEIPVRFRLEH